MTRRPAFADWWQLSEKSPLNIGWKVSGGCILPCEDLVWIPRKKVAIIAAGESKHDPACLEVCESPEFEVWALNAVPVSDRHGRARADRHWDLHQRVAQSQDDMRWIAECPLPIYVPDDLQDAGPNTVRYPIEAVEEKFGSYFSSTFAYMMGLALLEGATEIALYGVDLALGDWRERTVEWAGLSWWLGYAEAKGVTIRLPTDSWLGRHPARYGLEYTAEKENVEQYGRSVELGDMQRKFAKLKKEWFAHLPEMERVPLSLGDSVETDDDQPVGVGG